MAGMLRRLVVSLALVVALPALAHDAVTLDRLARLGKVWGTVRHAHPWLGYRAIDWDAAGARAIEKTLAARGADDFRVAVAEMLAELGDSQTRVVPTCADASPPLPAPAARILDRGVPYIHASSAVDEATKTAMQNAKVAIVDLRAIASCSGPEMRSDLVQLLMRSDIDLPDHRQVHHYGFRAQLPNDDDPIYKSSFRTVASPASRAGGLNLARVVFVVDDRSVLPPVAVALLHAGRAAVVSAGPMGARFPVTSVITQDQERFSTIIRTSELLDGFDRSMESDAAVTLPAGASEADILDAAVELATRRRHRHSTGWAGPRLDDYAWKPDAAYPEMKYPATAYRVLAGFRLWNVIRYFYGYPHLIGDWDAQFAPILAALIPAQDQAAYELALTEAMTHVPDGHSFVMAAAWFDLRGRARPPFFLMPVEGKPVVVETLDASATSAGIALGDELLSIDGRPIAERMNVLRRYTSASTESALAYYVTATAPNGPAGPAAFTFRKPDGTTYTATLTRGTYTVPAPATPWRMLPGNIGYVDLRWLETSQVAAMFAALQGTKGIIFDIRSYPRGVFPLLGRLLNTTGAPHISEIRVPEVLAAAVSAPLYRQDIGRASQPAYRGKTLALIDERAQSQAEHTCLTLQAVNGTRFVGSPTVGANGNVTYMMMPGNISIQFTGMDVRHADGRQLQRVGVLPDFPVPRTIAALAAGRDEVLERAAEILRNE